MYGLWADVLVAIHLAYVGFVIMGQLLIGIGVVWKWAWVRNPVFRWVHLSMIGIVAVEALAGLKCPLTTWEEMLRQEQWRVPLAAMKTLSLASSPLGHGHFLAVGALQDTRTPEISAGRFIGRCLYSLMFPPWPNWVFPPIYFGFTVLVLATFYWAPPRRKNAPLAKLPEVAKP